MALVTVLGVYSIQNIWLVAFCIYQEVFGNARISLSG